MNFSENIFLPMLFLAESLLYIGAPKWYIGAEDIAARNDPSFRTRIAEIIKFVPGSERIALMNKNFNLHYCTKCLLVFFFFLQSCGPRHHVNDSNVKVDLSTTREIAPEDANSILAGIIPILEKITEEQHEIYRAAQDPQFCATDPSSAAAYLAIAGKFEWNKDECLKTVDLCTKLAKKKEVLNARLACLILDPGDREEKNEIFDKLQAESNDEHEEITLFLNRAIILNDGNIAAIAENLAKSRNISPDDQRMILAFADISNRASSELENTDSVLNWLDELVQTAPILDQKSALVDNYISVLRVSYRFRDLIEYVRLNLEASSQYYFPALYLAVFVQGPEYWPELRKYYSVGMKYATPLSQFATERNSYNYTELKAEICDEAFSKGEALKDYEKTSWQFLSGGLTLSATKNKLTKILDIYGQKTDILTFLAELEFLDGKDEAAINLAMQAHQSCPFNERSHRVLQNIKEKRKLFQSTWFNKVDQEYREIMDGLEIPEALSKFVTNYKSLDSGSINALAYGIRIWLPYLNTLIDQEKLMTIKYSYQLLSAVHPKLGDVRVEVIPNDFRLWDDIRGAGGNLVIAEIHETRMHPYGAFNLAGHEVSHQVHSTFNETLMRCIVDLYKEAKDGKKPFHSPYASSNEWEYFATGVDISQLAADSPPSFGNNRSWLEKNDPRLLALIREFESGKDLSRISCPTS